MDSPKCKICGKEVREDEINICLNCGCVICSDDYDIDSGYCKNCAANGPYWGC